MGLSRASGLAIALVVAACARSRPPSTGAPSSGAPSTVPRADAIVEANVRAVFAQHLLLAEERHKGDPRCYAPGAVAAADLRALVVHQKGLLAADPAALRAWIRSEPSAFDPARDLAPILAAPLVVPPGAPVNVVTRALARASGQTEGRVRSLGSLYETVLELDRDGDLLQQEIDLYIALKLPVYDGQLGLPGTDADFLAAGRSLARETCASPFEVDAAAWQIAGRKLWSWGQKHLHLRDREVIAAELLGEPEVQALVPRLRALAPQRVAVLGHSFTMDAHWASPASFTAIAAAVLRRVNPGVSVEHWSDGGLGAARAERELYPAVRAWNPDQVLLVLLYRKDEDYDALARMLVGLRAAGARPHLFDNVREPSPRDRDMAARVSGIARDADVPLLAVSARLANAPDKESFVCLDGIHMTEPYHRFLAKEWLRFLAGSMR